MAITYHAGRRIQGLSGEQNTYTTTTTYDNANDTVVSVRSLYSNPLISNGEGERVGVRIDAGHSSIGTKVKKIKAKIAKHGTLVGNYEITIRDSNDTIKGIASATANNLTTSYTTIEHELDKVVTIATGDRISIEYDGTTRTANGVDLGTASANWVTNTTQQLYSTGGGWVNDPDGSVGRKFMFTFDSTPVTDAGGITNVQLGSRYEETDTRKMYDFTDPLVVDDDFTSYTDQTAFDNSWVTSNTAKFRGNPTNDNIDILNSNAYDNIYYDLGSVSDTKWLCRFKVTLTTAGSQSLGFCYFYVGSTTGDANESNDGLGFYFYDNANNTYALADNGNRPDQTTVTGALGINPSTTTYYAEMKRTSATSFTVTLYSDSSYSTSLGTATLTISSGITGLRYFKIMGYTTSGGLVGTFDDFKFYNNSTETSNYWQEIGT